MRKIPFFDYPYLFKSQSHKFKQIFEDVTTRGAFILQKDLEDFEKNLAKFSNTKYALGLANGTDALTIALLAAGIKEQDEVIFASHTYIATAAAIKFAGAKPIPADCKPDHTIDPNSVEKLITKKTKAILPTQLNGRCCDMDRLTEIAKKHNLFIIEDAAQALGARYKNKSVGSFDKGGAISFYPAKTLGCFGDGGAFLTNDDEMYQNIKLLRDHGRDEKGNFLVWGYNSRLDNLQAAFLDFKLSYYINEIDRRRELAKLYCDNLSHIPQLLLPPAANEDPNYFDVFQNFEIEAENRDQLRHHLEENGVATLIQWNGQPVHTLKKLGFKECHLPYTELMFSKCLLLPMNTSLKNDDVLFISQLINSFYRCQKK